MSISTATHTRATLVLHGTNGAHEMSMAIDMAQIPVSQAAEAAGLAEPILRHLVASGVIAGDVSVCDLDQALELAGQLAAARQPVEGQGILATDAARKYGFSDPSIYKWIADGWVRLVLDRPRNKLVNEGDIAFARALADLIGHAEGRAVFPAKPRSGRPRKSDN